MTLSPLRARLTTWPLRGVVTPALTMCSCVALAAPQVSPPPAVDVAAPSLFGEVMGVALPLILIILVLLAILYAARKRFGLTGQDAPLSVMQILPVGPRERIVLVKSRSGRVFAVGVANQSVNLITDLSAADLIAPATLSPSSPSESIDIAQQR